MGACGFLKLFFDCNKAVLLNPLNKTKKLALDHQRLSGTLAWIETISRESALKHIFKYLLNYEVKKVLKPQAVRWKVLPNFIDPSRKSNTGEIVPVTWERRGILYKNKLFCSYQINRIVSMLFTRRNCAQSNAATSIWVKTGSARQIYGSIRLQTA